MQQPLNSSFDKPNLARDGTPKRAQETFAPAHGMRNRTAPHSTISGSPFDDEPLQKDYEGKDVTINPGTPSHSKRGTHIDGLGAAVLNRATALGKLPQKAESRWRAM
jgi:hypothetical protein